MTFRMLCASLFLALAAVPLQAQTPADLTTALRIDDVVDVMRQEGLKYGSDLEEELFPGAGGTRWRAAVDLIYDPATMRRRFDERFSSEIAEDADAIAASMDFFDSERGQRIIALEIEARLALLDDAVEEAAKVAVDEMRAEAAPRFETLTRFAEVNDLIEQNVAGALNSNLSFYRGMSDAGAFGTGMSESDILSDVWSQEADIRAETEDWLYPFLSLAYQPLSDEDMAAYLDFSATDAGQKLNSAVFAAFDSVFSAISYDLGRAAARMLSGQDI